MLKAVSLDIGAGTVDFLLYSDDKPIENCIKMVLPSPQRVFADKIREITSQESDIFIDGYTIGGGAITSAIKNHLAKRYSVYMTSTAAFSLRNNLNEVKKLGVQITQERPDQSKHINLDEVRLDIYDNILNDFGETLKSADTCAISVKDHGATQDKISNRQFRINKFQKALQKNNNLDSFLFHENQVPEYYLRMKSAISSAKSYLPDVDIFVMDTSISALIGCLLDNRVLGKDPALLVNVGNGHTTAVILSEDKVLGFFEHHTSMLNTEKIVDFLKRFCGGFLSHKDVFDDGGHGVIMLEKPLGFSSINIIAVTGPKRGIMEDSGIDYVYAAPGGDVMMTGTLGIVDSIKKLYKDG
jgi:uncharacterized protein (DUF1786 family)